LEEALQAEGKKANKYFKDLTERSGELELKDFLTKQLEQKLADLQGTAADLRKDIEEKRATINRLTASIEDQNRVLMAAEKEKSDVSQEKSAAQDEITLKKERIGELEA
jgi:chromosome segregation ATPase